MQRYYFYQKKEQFIDDFLNSVITKLFFIIHNSKDYCRKDTFFLKRNLLVYSHSGSIHVLGSLLLILAYLIDDGDGSLCEFDGYCLSCSLALDMSCAADFLSSSLFAFAKNIWRYGFAFSLFLEAMNIWAAL